MDIYIHTKTLHSVKYSLSYPISKIGVDVEGGLDSERRYLG